MLPWKNIPRYARLLGLLLLVCKTGMAPHQNTMFCDPKIASLVDIHFGNRSKGEKRNWK